MQGFGQRLYFRRIAQKERLGHPLLGHMVGGPNNNGVIPLGQHDTPGILLGTKNDLAHDLPLRSQTGFQLLDIGFPVRQRDTGDAACDGGFRNRRHHF